MDTPDPLAVVRRMSSAANIRDIESLVRCFAADYRNDTPAHPARSFTGRQQVRSNWEQIFAAIPDLEIEIVDHAVRGSSVWTEQEHRGTRPDGTAHQLRGVVVFEVAGNEVAAARFFLEPVEAGGDDVTTAVRRQVRPDGNAS